MNTGKFLLIVCLCFYYFEGRAQEISIHPRVKVDSVWYSDVTEDSEPEHLSCEKNDIGYFRMKFTSEIVVDEFKKDTIKTKKEDWEKEDEEAFDEKYNEEKKEELEELKKEFIEEDIDIATQAEEEIDRYIEVNWNGYQYNICKPDCESVMEQCYIYHEITQLKDSKKTYKYRTSYSWLEEKEESDNEVELELDLVINYEAWIYFYVTCSCNDIPDLVSFPSKLLNESNPWAHIDLLGERMKPFYASFTAAKSKSFPLIPVLGGAIGGGTLIYLLTKDEEKTCGTINGFNIQNTTCGDQSGSIEITLDPPGNYLYTWSNGESTSAISNLYSGTYSVLVNQPGTECSDQQVFTVSDMASELGFVIVNTTPSDCGLNNGSATISNPADDINYSWSNGSTGSTATGLAGDDYSVTATKGTCTGVVSFTVIENDPNFVLSSDTELPGCGQSDGFISVSVTPEGNYTYKWSNGPTTPDNTALGQGSYEVSVTDTESGCTKTVKYNLNEKPADFTLSFTTSDASCGGSDGSISVDVEPSGNYNFLWSNGGTTQTLTEVPAGEYTVTVTLEDSECTGTGSSTIKETPFSIEIEFFKKNPNCGLADGNIAIQLTPSGNYIYEWSNGQTEQNINDLSAGTYSLTISDPNGCTATGQTILEDEVIVYVENLESFPGDCITEGSINITLITPGGGPIVTIITAPNNVETLFLNEGTSDLSAMTEISPGNYSIEVYDQNAGPDCSQTVDIVVEDNTPELLAVDDNYETIAGEPVSGNLLNNDMGLNITINTFFEENGGTVMVEDNGNFQFIPSDDFEGEAIFQYDIQDACGSLDTAMVFILVNQVDCDFITQFEIMAASCGLEDGSIITTTEPSGNYSYAWSNGSTETNLTLASAGSYLLTITDNDLGCFLTFETTITENEPNYVSNLTVVQPICAVPADIQFELNTSFSGSFLVTISHPNGIDAFVIPSGTVFLSDYLPIIAGTYTISLYDSNAGPGCTETFSVLILEPTELIISLISIIPPSSSTANDGAVVIEVTFQGIPPYDIWVNGDIWDQTSDNEFIISGFSVGEYSIFLTDATGCMSNIIEIFVPPPMVEPLKVGVGFIAFVNSTPENTNSTEINIPHFFIEISHDFELLGMNNNTGLRYLHHDKEPHFYLSHLVEISRFRLNQVSFSIKGGLQFDYSKGQFQNPGLISELSGRINLINPLCLDVFVSNSSTYALPMQAGIRFKM
jgi:hypothetical protein